MPYLTVVDVFNVLSGEIKARFSDTPLDFVGKEYPNRPELWVYVLDVNRYAEVKAFCEELEARNTDPATPISIVVKLWTGRWPRGETEEERRQKVDEFLKRRGQPVNGHT